MGDGARKSGLQLAFPEFMATISLLPLEAQTWETASNHLMENGHHLATKKTNKSLYSQNGDFSLIAKILWTSLLLKGVWLPRKVVGRWGQ